MKATQFKKLLREEVRKVLREEDYSQQVDRIEAKAKLFIKNPALKQYTTDETWIIYS